MWPVARQAVAIVGGVLCKAFLVPLLTRVANGIPVDGLGRLSRALWQRVLGQGGLQP